MTAGLETFAKVRALHDRASIPGEKAAAAGRMEALARAAGMTVDEAVSKLDAAPPQPDLAAAARAWAERYEAEAAARAADAPEAGSRRRGLPIYDPNKIECWRDVAEHCLQLDWIIPKAHGGRFLTKDERERLKKIARRFSPVTNATADWIETVLARCEAARVSWRDRGKAGVRPDRKATETDIEKAAELVAAAKQREASELDTSASGPRTHAQATADAFNEFFNSPNMRAQRAERDREREIRRAEILKRYGSRKAVYAETEREAALRAACGPMTTWKRRGDPGSCTLDGWDWLQSREKVPPQVRAAVAKGWPLPCTVKEAWAEYIASEERESERQALHDCEHFAAPWVEVRRCILEDLLDSLPAHSIGDMLVRQSWLEHLNERGFSRDVARDAVLLATQRADIERMGERIREQGEGVVSTTPVQSGQAGDGEGDGQPSPTVQSGHGKRSAPSAHPSGPRNSAQGYSPSEYPSPVQSGHPRRTNADKRRDVIALLKPEDSRFASLTDREIGRRAGVSPTTVGSIRRSLA